MARGLVDTVSPGSDADAGSSCTVLRDPREKNERFLPKTSSPGLLSPSFHAQPWLAAACRVAVLASSRDCSIVALALAMIALLSPARISICPSRSAARASSQLSPAGG